MAAKLAGLSLNLHGLTSGRNQRLRICRQWDSGCWFLTC